MSGVESSGVTLALVDSSILSCWEEMVKQGKECSIMLKHSKGNVTVKLQSTSKVSPLPQASLSASAEAKKGKKKSKKKRLERLLAYHQRLVEERGLPPSRLMLQQAAAVLTSQPSQSHGQTEKQFKCDQCEFSSESQRGFKVHMGRRHKDLQLSENLRDDESEESLAVSPLKEVREELPEAIEVSSPTSVSDSVAECGFKCACCGQRCQSEEALRIHLRDKHGLPKKCSDCDTMHFNFVSLATCYKAHMGIESE